MTFLLIVRPFSYEIRRFLFGDFISEPIFKLYLIIFNGDAGVTFVVQSWNIGVWIFGQRERGFIEI